MPESSQTSTGAPLRACWWVASQSGTETVLPTVNHYRVMKSLNRTKCAITLKITYFSGSEHCWKQSNMDWDNVSIQINKIYKIGLVIFKHLQYTFQMWQFFLQRCVVKILYYWFILISEVIKNCNLQGNSLKKVIDSFFFLKIKIAGPNIFKIARINQNFLWNKLKDRIGTFYNSLFGHCWYI